MWIFIVILSIVCICLAFSYAASRKELGFLCRQLEEIAEGSHIELTVQSRQKAALALCRLLNSILAEKDKNHAQYEKAERLMRQNVTSLAHDIRTPLTGAMGYVQLARECMDSEKKEHYLQAAEARMEELEDMLEEMFLYTKLSSEEFELSIRKLQVLPLLGDCLLSLYTKFEERGIEPEVSFESEGFYVYGDEDALRRVFLNLIQNALVHGIGGITITQKGNCLIFENSVPDGSRPNPQQIFDRFYKCDSARRKGSSGLGLFIVKELVNKMQGEVWAELDGGILRIVLSFSLVEKKKKL